MLLDAGISFADFAGGVKVPPPVFLPYILPFDEGRLKKVPKNQQAAGFVCRLRLSARKTTHKR
jgi:hypothetical protein